MRKIFSVAVCAVTLAGAGISQASIDSNPLAPISDTLTSKFQQFSQLMDGGVAKGLKTEVAYRVGNNRSATGTPDVAAEEGNHAMLIAGLMIMGVIIKRRYGKGD